MLIPLHPVPSKTTAAIRTAQVGFLSDCTGATAGSLAGACIGAQALPQKWVGDFHDRLESIVIGMTDNRFTDLAGRTLAQAHRLAP